MPFLCRTVAALSLLSAELLFACATLGGPGPRRLDASLGYRFRIGRGFAIRIGGQYRRWFGDYDRINEFGVALGLGGII